MKRRTFINSLSLLGAGVLLNEFSFAADFGFPTVRVAAKDRKFKSPAIEKAIKEFQSAVKDKELGWLFENCFPNTLDTTVSFNITNGKPDTYVITGDIDAMWLRDSSAQVWPYLLFINEDPRLKQLIAGVINRQTKCVLKDPYANAFYNEDSRVGEWSKDLTQMKPGVHERKWEIDSLCYPIRLAYHYWKATGDLEPFDANWKKAITTTLRVFKEQQRKINPGPYKFQRVTHTSTDTQPLGGYGYPVKPNGLICSAFRPSDDATIYPFLIPANFFAAVSLRQASAMVKDISRDAVLAGELSALADEVNEALNKHAYAEHPELGRIYAFEIDGFGSFNFMDDANVPSLLSLPYLGAVDVTDPAYQNTRKFIFSNANPFYFKGKYGEGVGGPHVGMDMIWPMSIIIRGLTTTNDEEIKSCIQALKSTHGNTGFMHESFHKDDAANFTRKWFAWANTLFGEFLWKVYKEKPELLTG